MALSVASGGGHRRRHGQLLDRGLYRPSGIQRRVPIPQEEHLDRTHAFFEKYGGKTIIIARFVPIVRTFAPFVAGIGAMNYAKFIIYNVVGGVAWVALFVFGGYWFGTQPFVKGHFSLVVLAIIVISVMPMVIGYFGISPSASIQPLNSGRRPLVGRAFPSPTARYAARRVGASKARFPPASK